jgi:hypothetical protein
MQNPIRPGKRAFPSVRPKSDPVRVRLAIVSAECALAWILPGLPINPSPALVRLPDTAAVRELLHSLPMNLAA